MSDACKVCGRIYANYNEGHTPNSRECLQNQLHDARSDIEQLKARGMEEHTTDGWIRPEEANKLIQRLQQAENLLRESQEHFTFGLEFGAKFPAPTHWMKRRDAFLNPTNKDVK